MKGYSYTILENPQSYAFARIEGVNASYKDLCEVCGRVLGLSTEKALILLEEFSQGNLPVLFKSRNKRLGARRELGGRKGRYPKKAASMVLGALQSAIANAQSRGMIAPYIIVHICANKKRTFPRMSPKGRRSRSDYETARIEVVVREKEIIADKKKLKVEVSKPKETSVEKKAEAQAELTKIKKEPEAKNKKQNAEKKPAPKKKNINSGDNQ
ncbi:MAG: uL22 family ribosomal protein [Candidatus Micrarchaeia archaeon]